MTETKTETEQLHLEHIFGYLARLERKIDQVIRWCDGMVETQDETIAKIDELIDSVWVEEADATAEHHQRLFCNCGHETQEHTDKGCFHLYCSCDKSYSYPASEELR